MSVSAITQSHAAATEHTQAPASHKAQSGESKANTAQATASASRAQEAQQTQAAAAAQNHAGQDRGAKEWWSGWARQFVRVGFARRFGGSVRRSGYSDHE
jgi:hypothetical protein